MPAFFDNSFVGIKRLVAIGLLVCGSANVMAAPGGLLQTVPIPSLWDSERLAMDHFGNVHCGIKLLASFGPKSVSPTTYSHPKHPTLFVAKQGTDENFEGEAIARDASGRLVYLAAFPK